MFTVSAMSGEELDPIIDRIHKQLSQGQVVVIYQMLNDDKTSEQYADWSGYLNDFSSTHTAGYQFYEANQHLNEILANNQIDVSDSYTLFLKQGHPSYFYQGVVVEAMVYYVVDQAYAGLLIDSYKAFLPTAVTVGF